MHLVGRSQHICRGIMQEMDMKNRACLCFQMRCSLCQTLLSPNSQKFEDRTLDAWNPAKVRKSWGSSTEEARTGVRHEPQQPKFYESWKQVKLNDDNERRIVAVHRTPRPKAIPFTSWKWASVRAPRSQNALVCESPLKAARQPARGLATIPVLKL